MIQDPHSVIQTIRLSEKTTRLGEENNQYVFIVDRKANKLQIKAAVEKHFGKKVEVSAPVIQTARHVANVVLTMAARIIIKRPSFVPKAANVSTSCNFQLGSEPLTQRTHSHGAENFQAQHPIEPL